MRRVSRLAIVFMLGVLFQVSAASQDYYPLEVGNRWFFRSIYQAVGDSNISSSFRVTGDSLFSNGHRYFVLDSSDVMEARFLRRDSAFVYYFNRYTGQDTKIFDLNAGLGDTLNIHWGSYFTVRLVAIDTFDVLGLADRVLTYAFDGLEVMTARLSRMFGPLSEELFGDPPGPWPFYGRRLVGCQLGNISYGKTVHVPQLSGLVTELKLGQNFPNPFNPNTRIEYSVNSTACASLRIFDIVGRHVRWLVDGTESPGLHAASWDGRDDLGYQRSSGVYLYELRVGGVRQVRRMLLLR